MKRSSKPNPLRRNQARIDAIGHLLNANQLLDHRSIHQLADDLGDLEDAVLMLLDEYDGLRESLEQVESAPKPAFQVLAAIRGWFIECRAHMRRAARLIDNISDEIIRRNPDQFPWAEEEEDDSS